MKNGSLFAGVHLMIQLRLDKCWHIGNLGPKERSAGNHSDIATDRRLFK